MVLHSSSHAIKTLELLNSQRKSKVFTNFVIYVSGEKFSVHQSLLAAHSPVIKRALEASYCNQETSPNLSLDGIDKGSFEVLLDFLYSSKLEVNSANVDRLLSTSQSLEISSVVELCKQYKNSMADVNIVDCSFEDDEKETTSDEFVFESQTIKIEVTADESARNIPDVISDDNEESTVSADDDQSKRPFPRSKPGRKPALRFSCPVCGKVMTEYRMKVHMRSHTGEKVAACRICHKTFANIYNLRIHEYIHTGEKPYKCCQCPRTFSDPSSLSKHKLWHAGVRRQKCDVCGRLFSTRAHLTQHMRTHTKERPFSCPKCNKMFAYKCDLKRHMKTHNGDLLGPCSYCGRYFTHPGNYRAHIRNHEKKNQKPTKSNPSDLTFNDNDVTSGLAPTFLLSEGCEGTVELVGDDNQCRIVKVRDLAELMARGHEIEVVIGDGDLIDADSSGQSSSSDVAITSSVDHELAILDSSSKHSDH